MFRYLGVRCLGFRCFCEGDLGAYGFMRFAFQLLECECVWFSALGFACLVWIRWLEVRCLGFRYLGFRRLGLRCLGCAYLRFKCSGFRSLGFSVGQF